MKKIIHIFTGLLITLSTVLPAGLVVCEKNGSISIEFEQGEICSCDLQSKDLISKFCCDDSDCHDDEAVTSSCHDKNHLESEDCNDTKIEASHTLKFFQVHLPPTVKILKYSNFFSDENLLLKELSSLEEQVITGKFEKPVNEFPLPVPFHLKTTVLII